MTTHAPKAKRCPNIAWAFWYGRNRNLSPRERLILMALAERADAGLSCSPTQEMLAEDTGLSHRTVNDAVNDLLLGRKERGTRSNPPGCLKAERLRSGLRYTLVRAPEEIAPTQPAESAHHDTQILHDTNAGSAPSITQNLRILAQSKTAISAHHDEQKPPADARRYAESAHSDTQISRIPIKSPLKESPKEERTLLCNGAAASPYAATPAADVRRQLWGEGKTILRRLTGQTTGPAGNQIGKFLKSANEDCSIVLETLRAAEREQPHEPVSWVFAGIKSRRCRRLGVFDTIREDLGGASFLTQTFDDEEPGQIIEHRSIS